MGCGHVVMFPFMAQGHINPFIALARLIEQRKCCTITLVSTPLNIRKLQLSLPSYTTIRFAELPFPGTDYGLAPNLENTDSLPLHLFPFFFEASEALQSSFELLISGIIKQEGRNNLCILADMFLGWTVKSAKKLGVFHSVFITSGAYSSTIVSSLWLHPPCALSLSEEVPLVDLPEVQLHISQVVNTIIFGDGKDPVTTFMRRQISLCFESNGILINTVEEFEKTGMRLLRKSTGLPVWAIGPSICSRPTRADGYYIRWLDLHLPTSVLYVSFGSQNTIAASQMMELAMGLEASGKPFIWVIRPPVEFDDEDEFRAEWLPEGFEDRLRMKNQGLLIRGWAPQLEILSHESTGAFLSHCGWNSVLESLSKGVPIIGWPLLGDQMYNSKMLAEEMGVCVEVARGRKTKGLETGKEGVERAIELVMGATEKGREMRRNAREIQVMLRGATREEGALVGSSLKAMEDFFRTAISKG